MAWMMDTYSMNTGLASPGVVTGKPVHLGGSLGQVKATGRGVFVIGREVMRRLNMPVQGVRIAIQGFGNVGATTSELFAKAGALIVAAQDFGGTICNFQGLSIAELADHVQRHRTVGGFPGGENLNPEAFWDVPCEVIIPAALEGQITVSRAKRLRAQLVLEGANGPTLPEADDVLGSRGIVVVPDVICNSGGVTVSYFEWVQDFAQLLFGPRTRLISAWKKSFSTPSNKFGKPRRDAAFPCAQPHSWWPASGY